MDENFYILTSNSFIYRHILRTRNKMYNIVESYLLGGGEFSFGKLLYLVTVRSVKSS